MPAQAVRCGRRSAPLALRRLRAGASDWLPSGGGRWPGLAPAGDSLSCTRKKGSKEGAPLCRRLRRCPLYARRRRVVSQTRPAGSNSDTTIPAAPGLRSAAQKGKGARARLRRRPLGPPAVGRISAAHPPINVSRWHRWRMRLRLIRPTKSGGAGALHPRTTTAPAFTPESAPPQSATHAAQTQRPHRSPTRPRSQSRHWPCPPARPAAGAGRGA